MSDELRRAFVFIAAGDMRGARREPASVGVAVFDDSLPLRHDSNYLLVEAGDVTAEELERDVHRLDRPAILFRDAELGERLAPHFAGRGWFVHRGLLMAQRDPPVRASRTMHVEEVDESELRAGRRERLADEPWARDDLVGQLLDAKRVIARHVEARFFAVRADGRPVSWTDLYLDGRTAQIEDVATLPAYRRRGYARAVVAHAADEARRAGCDLVFLATDAEDPVPQRLYRTLGFTEIGRYVKFFRELT